MEICKKIKAFTLMELIVGLVISGIVMAMAAAAFNIIRVQFWGYRKTNEQLQNQSAFAYLVKKDIDESHSLLKIDENSFEADCKDKKVLYRWRGGIVTRMAGIAKDTFAVKIASAKILFQGKESGAGQLIDQVNFRIENNDGFRNFYLKKMYSSGELMKIHD